jgi:hypothetical protein
MKKPSSGMRLKSSFTSTGKLKVPVSDFIKRLQDVPSLNLLKGSEIPTFSVGTKRTGNSELQLAGNKLVFNYWFDRMSLKEYTKNLIKFLALLTYLSDIYEANFASLYPYLTEVLVEHTEEMHSVDHRLYNTTLLIKQTKGLAEMNCSLSLKIIELQAEFANLKSDNAILSRFSEEVLANASENTKSANPDSLPRALGTNTETYRAISSILSKKELK